MFFLKSSSLTVFALLLAISNAFGQSSDPNWLDDLRTQLLFDEKCEVDYFLNIREQENAWGTLHAARVQCRDGRQFDAMRKAQELKFTIESCNRAVCELEPQKPVKT